MMDFIKKLTMLYTCCLLLCDARTSKCDSDVLDLRHEQLVEIVGAHILWAFIKFAACVYAVIQMVKMYKASIQQTLDIMFLRDGVEFVTSSDCVSRDSADRTLIAWDFQTTAKLSNQIYHVRDSLQKKPFKASGFGMDTYTVDAWKCWMWKTVGNEPCGTGIFWQ